MRFALRLASVTVFVWATFVWRVSFAQSDTYVTNDRIRAQLLAMGKPGSTVAVARDHVIEILQAPNSCSAWFQGVDPNVVSTFASLKFIIETNGPQEVLGFRSHSGEMLLKHPYSARAIENGGASSIVLLNAKGAFFVPVAAILWQEDTSGLLHASGWRYLLVGSYRGDTLRAQITILLHELGHVVGRLPDDSDELSGQSGRNTAEVLHFCRAQINAASGSPSHPGP